MKINYSFKNHIKKNIAYYLIALVIMPVLSSAFIKMKTRAKDYEKYSIFIGADVKELTGFKNYVHSILTEDLEIHAYYESEDSSTFSTVLSGNGVHCDILILSNTKASSLTVSELLDVSKCGFLPKENMYSNYGVSLRQNEHLLLDEYINYKNDEYFVFFNPDSVHHLNIQNEGKTNQTERLIKEIYGL